MMKRNDSSVKATDALQALVAITNAVQTECEGYAILGEYEPCKVCLEEFKAFIVENQLDNRDTLLMINESAAEKKIDVVDKFGDISRRIAAFDTSLQIEYNVHELLIPDEEKGDDNDE